MKRGILTFTNQELQQLHLYLSMTGSQHVQLLAKLTVSTHKENDEMITVELSAEEVETLLDCLPLPTQDKTAMSDSLRTKLLQF